jgi:hypothetical protein
MNSSVSEPEPVEWQLFAEAAVEIFGKLEPEPHH